MSSRGPYDADPGRTASGAPAKLDAVIPDAGSELLDDGQEEVFAYTAVANGLVEDPRAMGPDDLARVPIAPDTPPPGSSTSEAPPAIRPVDEGAPEPTLTGGEIPPIFADVDETAEPRLAEPRMEQPLTRRIHQGMPSYSEPEPQIAGVVGRAPRSGEEASSPKDSDTAAPRDGGVP